jgi:hypothetical protein
LRVGVLDGEVGTTFVVADGLADIWRDLQDGLDGFSAGSLWQNVCWEWLFGLNAH